MLVWPGNIILIQLTNYMYGLSFGGIIYRYASSDFGYTDNYTCLHILVLWGRDAHWVLYRGCGFFHFWILWSNVSYVVFEYFRKVHIHDLLREVLEHNRKNSDLENINYLTKSLHVWPDFHGNRSPLADPTLKGMVNMN